MEDELVSPDLVSMFTGVGLGPAMAFFLTGGQQSLGSLPSNPHLGLEESSLYFLSRTSFMNSGQSRMCHRQGHSNYLISDCDIFS